MESQRLDVKMVQWGLVPSRAKAQELIRSGWVEVRIRDTWRTIPTRSFSVAGLKPSDLRFKDNEAPSLLQYVSRGGLKLSGALAAFQIDLDGKRILDVGVSTGGFSDCALRHGACEVVGVDVGHDQLAFELRGHPQLTVFEGMHVRDLAGSTEFQDVARSGFDWILMDVSFISCLKALPYVVRYLRPNGRMLVLVKPQFELGGDALDKRGIVKDDGQKDGLQARIEDGFRSLGLIIQGYIESQIKGQDGNQEYFALAEPKESL